MPNKLEYLLTAEPTVNGITYHNDGSKSITVSINMLSDEAKKMFGITGGKSNAKN